MQQKRGNARVGVFLLAVAGLCAVGLAVLTLLPVPAPQAPIEKTLDAKAFLAGKS